VSPAVYGTVVLVLGVLTLAHGLAAGPLMQAVLRFYPEFAAEGREGQLRQAVRVALRKPLIVTVVALAFLGASWASLQPQQAWLVFFALALFVTEVARSVEVTFLNAARRQRAMALLMAADAWLRPIAAVALVWVFGANGAAVMAGYLVGCTLALAGFRLVMQTRGHRDRSPMTDTPASVETEVPRQLWAYALPLTPLPLIGWVSGQADRYLVGGLCGFAAAGIYAALYGLASKPFILLSAGLDSTLRQPYYGRVSAGDAAGEQQALALWLVLVAAGALALCLLLVLFHAELAALVLAAEYRVHSALMGWIATGYVLLGMAQVFDRVCYAHHDTVGVLWVQATCAALSVVIAVPLVWGYGIEGAAWAVPVYFSAQLLLTAKRARSARRQGRQLNATAKAADISIT